MLDIKTKEYYHNKLNTFPYTKGTVS